MRSVYHNNMKLLVNNAMSNQPVQVTIPTQADLNLVLAPHPDSASLSTSSGSDDNNANNNFFRLKSQRFGEICSPTS